MNIPTKSVLSGTIKSLFLFYLLMFAINSAWAEDVATFYLGESPGISTPDGFFTHNENGKWNFNNKFTDAYYDGYSFNKGLKMESTTEIYFTTETVSKVTIVQSTWSDYTIKFDGEELDVADAEEGTNCRIYTLTGVVSGDHIISRGSGESGLFYIKIIKPEPYAVLSNNNTVLTFYYDDQKEAREGMSIGPFDANEYDWLLGIYSSWYDHRNGITSVVFDESFANCTTITSTAYWFYGLSNLTSITGIEYLNTENVISMLYMFSGCNNLILLDATHFDTRNVTNMGAMFAECSSLTSLDVSHFDTRNVTNMASMFDDCYSLTSLDLSNFNTDNVTNIWLMFDNCSNLKTIYAGSGWNTEKVDYEEKVCFTNCTSLIGGKGTAYDANHTDYTYAHIDGGPSNPGYFTAAGAEPWTGYAVLSDNNTVLTFYYDDQKTARGGMDVGPFSGNEFEWLTGVAFYSSWHDHRNSITSVFFDESFANCTTITSTAYWFYELSSLTSITGIEYLNTGNVTSMNYMFYGCSGLTSLDVSNFDTWNVTDMYAMFSGCSGLISLDLSNFDTGKVEYMDYMFYNCFSLTTIKVGNNWSTESIINGSNMFSGCTKLVGGRGTAYDKEHTGYTYAHIDGGTANPGYLTDIDAPVITEPEPYALLSDDKTVLTIYYDTQRYVRGGMEMQFSPSSFDNSNHSITSVVFDSSFAGCTSISSTSFWFLSMSGLTSIKGIEYLNTENVTSMEWMFYGCSGLTSLDVSHFDTGNVTSMYGMFDGCSGLTSLDVSHFDTGNVTNMEWMFYGCSGLTSLDVSHFDTGNVTNMSYMFAGCSGLTSLDVSNFDTGNVTDMCGMFRDCSSLTSLDLSSFNTSKVIYDDGNFYGISVMLSGCSDLTTIYVGDGWTTANLTESPGVFTGCTHLVGGAGTKYDASHTDYTYAHIDGGPANPGYFTDKNAPVITEAVATPTFVVNKNTLTITTDTEDATIYFTMDGTEPTMESTVYTSPIILTQNCTVKAIAVREGYVDSDVASLVVTNFVTGMTLADVAITTGKSTTINVTPVPANGLYDPSLVTPTVTTSDDIPDGWYSLELERLSENGLQWSATAYSLGAYTINILYDGKPMGTGTVNVGQQLNLKDGWQWIALQGGTIGKGDLESVFGDQLDEARSETAMVINDPQAGYWGTLETMDYAETYKVRMNLGNSEHTYDIMGAYHNMMLNPITRDLHVGWNWVGNPYQYWQDINDIFTNGSKFTEGDIVKTKTQFATYTDGKWQPAIYVEPAQGMMVYKQAASEIGFNSEYSMQQNFTSPAASRNLQPSVINLQFSMVDDSRFDDNMAMVAQVEGISDPSAITLWAFVGDECRGRGIGVGSLQFITVHGQQGEHFTFKVCEHTTGEIRSVKGSQQFAPINGSPKAPVILQAGTVISAIADCAKEFGQKKGLIYDLQGRRVKSSILNSSSIQKKGVYIQDGHKVVVR